MLTHNIKIANIAPVNNIGYLLKGTMLAHKGGEYNERLHLLNMSMLAPSSWAC